VPADQAPSRRRRENCIPITGACKARTEPLKEKRETARAQRRQGYWGGHDAAEL